MYLYNVINFWGVTIIGCLEVIISFIILLNCWFYENENSLLNENENSLLNGGVQSKLYDN